MAGARPALTRCEWGSEMANFYKYAIVRLAPDDVRGERINVGVAVFANDGLDIHVAKRVDKVRAISSAVDAEVLRELIDNLRELDLRFTATASLDNEQRRDALARIGPLSLSQLGTFVADGADAYESRIASLMRALVDPEPAPVKMREKRSKLLTQVKQSFKRDRVLARKDEDLSSHRIVSGYELEHGLVADLVLQNGALHVVETVDASGEEETLRKAIGDIGVAALVLERARMKFGERNTKARLVYSASSALETIAQPSLEAAAHQGAELINWASADDRRRFLHNLSSLATPIERKRRVKSVVSGKQTRLFN